MGWQRSNEERGLEQGDYFTSRNGSVEHHPKTHSSQPSASSPTQINSRFIYHHSLSLTTMASAQQPRMAYHSTTPVWYPVSLHTLPTEWSVRALRSHMANSYECPSRLRTLGCGLDNRLTHSLLCSHGSLCPKPSLKPDVPREVLLRGQSWMDISWTLSTINSMPATIP